MKTPIVLAMQRLSIVASDYGSLPPASSLAGRAVGLATLSGLMFAPALAQAQTVTGGASPATMINNICSFILGPFGQSLAVLGIIAIGLSWMFGRVSLGLIAGVIGGIVIMFGASYLGSTLTGGTAG
jgi:type IV secretion system protein VirB2